LPDAQQLVLANMSQQAMAGWDQFICSNIYHNICISKVLLLS